MPSPGRVVVIAEPSVLAVVMAVPETPDSSLLTQKLGNAEGELMSTTPASESRYSHAANVLATHRKVSHS